MKHILEAIGVSFCLACCCSSVQARAPSCGSNQIVVKAKPPKPVVSSNPYFRASTAALPDPFPPIELTQTPYQLPLNSIKFATSGDFSLDGTKTILTVNKGGIYEVTLHFHPTVEVIWPGMWSTGFIWTGLALADANSKLVQFRPYYTHTYIGVERDSTGFKISHNEHYCGSWNVLLPLQAGTQLRLNVERSFTEFKLAGTDVNPALSLSLYKIADLPV